MKFGSSLLVLSLLFAASTGLHAEEDRVLVAQAVGPPQKVTLQFQGMDVVEVLKILAEQAGFDLVDG